MLSRSRVRRQSCEALPLAETVVTIDAMGCRREIAAWIAGKKPIRADTEGQSGAADRAGQGYLPLLPAAAVFDRFPYQPLNATLYPWTLCASVALSA